MSLGIITFTDKIFFDNFRLFFNSLRILHNTPVCLFYDELDDWQIEWCNSKNIVIKLLDGKQLLPNLSFRIGPVNWRTFLKPYCFMRSPFVNTFWFDSDMFIIRTMNSFFEKIKSAPVFSPETCCGVRYSDQFISLVPLSPSIKDNPRIHINAGLIGLNVERKIDTSILYSWVNVINAAENNPEIRRLMKGSDQDALLWAVQQEKATKYIMNHIQGSMYNHSPNPRVEFEGDNLIEEIKSAYDHRLDHHNCKPHCLHWFGGKKLKELCKKSFDKIVLKKE